MPRKKPTILLATLVSVTLLGGCAQFIRNAEEGNTRQVIIVHKTKPVRNISKIDIDLSNVNLDKTTERAQKNRMRSEIIENLKDSNLYQNGQGSGDRLEVDVDRVDDSLVSKRMQIRTQIYDSKGNLVGSTMTYTAGKGLKRLGYERSDFSLEQLREAYADNLAHYLKKSPRHASRKHTSS